MFREIIEGLFALSTAKSLNDKCVVGSYLDSFSTVTSPDRQNEKNVGGCCP